MSYILDALKKSEAERMRAIGQAAPAGHVAAAPPRRRIGLLVWPAILLIAAAVLFSALQRHEPEAGAPRASRDAAHPAEEQPVPEAATPRPFPDMPALPVRQAAEAPQPLAHPAAVPATPPDTHAAPIPARSELPADRQRELPQLHIEGHIYDDDPAARMVIIDGRIRREGDLLGDGLQLENITASGIVLNHRGTRFRMGVFDR